MSSKVLHLKPTHRNNLPDFPTVSVISIYCTNVSSFSIFIPLCLGSTLKNKTTLPAQNPSTALHLHSKPRNRFQFVVASRTIRAKNTLLPVYSRALAKNSSHGMITSDFVDGTPTTFVSNFIELEYFHTAAL